MNVGSIFRALGKLPQLLVMASTAAATVEAVGAVAKATGPEKRSAAVAQLRAQVHSLDLPLPDYVLGAMVDAVVWLLNSLTDREWAKDAQEGGAQVSAGALEAARNRAGPDDVVPSSERYERRAREELERIAAKNRRGADHGEEERQE